MKKAVLISVVLILLICIGAGCSFIKPVQIGKIKAFKIKDISLQNINLDVTLPVKNPNWFAIKIQKFELEVQINKMAVGTITDCKSVVIPAHSDENLEINVSLKMTNILTGTLAMLQAVATKEILVNVEGKVYAKAFIFSKTVEINQEELVKIN